MSNLYKKILRSAKLYRGDTLKINLEYRMGILFVRLSGELTIKTVNKFNRKVSLLVSNNGITNIVFNIQNLKRIDYKGIHSILYNYELVNRYNGRIYICGINIQNRPFIKKSHLLNYIYEIPNELCAIKIMKG